MRGQVQTHTKPPTHSVPASTSSLFEPRPFSAQSTRDESSSFEGDGSSLFAAYLQRRAAGVAGEVGTTRSQMLIQPKLTLGPVGDRYEQEADQVAKQVVGRVNGAAAQGAPLGTGDRVQRAPAIQSVPMGHGMRVGSSIESGINRARGGGQLLPDYVRAPMEQAFGTDFSGVRVHTDAHSDRLNRSLSARAFTTGQDVFFRQGAYNPTTSGGQALLAHELTHVVQQRGAVGQIQLADVPSFFDDFATKVRKMVNGISDDEMSELWDAFILPALEFRTEGVGSPGKYSEEVRLENVEQYYQAASQFLHLFGQISAQEGSDTLLWSGYGIGRVKANLVEGGTPLNQTQIGQLFDVLAVTNKESPLVWAESYNIWAAVSKEFAANARGDVHVYVPQGITAGSIFWNVELPELRVRQWSGQVSNIFIHFLKSLEAFNNTKEEDQEAFLNNDANWKTLSVDEAPIFANETSQEQEQASGGRLKAKAGSSGLMTPEKLKTLADKWRKKAKNRNKFSKLLLMLRDIAMNLSG